MKHKNKEVEKILTNLRRQIMQKTDLAVNDIDDKIHVNFEVSLGDLYEIGICEEETKEWQDGFFEGEVCGAQSVISDMLICFLNTDYALNNKIAGLTINVDENGNYELRWKLGKRKRKIKTNS